MNKCAVFLAVACVLAVAAPGAAQLYLEFAGSPIRDNVPVDCSEWHELWPNFCVIHHQDAYQDNGDGAVSVCDVITLNGTRYHIDWVGPTYELENVSTSERSWWEPTGHPIDDPWHQVAPLYCVTMPVIEWLDENWDGELSECDLVFIGGAWHHIAAINLDITVTEEPSPTNHETWSAIKSLFRTF
jgi:hypothetical protein